ncbi:hypothetical protein P7C71_g3016, partial [Lecanoromycetidae sp. Uapishka_2]
MSGIEAAGLVLAVFPLVVSGLQHFTEGVETIKSWKRYQRELSNYVRTLETQATYCQDTIEELFDGIIQSDDEYKALKNDPGGATWRKPEEDLDLTEVMTNFNTASRLIPNVYEEGGVKYGDVVRRCLKTPPDVRDATLDNEEFQAAVFEYIVTPLRETFDIFNGTMSIK